MRATKQSRWIATSAQPRRPPPALPDSLAKGKTYDLPGGEGAVLGRAPATFSGVVARRGEIGATEIREECR